MKVFMLVIMPLLTSGVLVKLFSSVGIRLPAGLQRMMGGQQQQMRQTTERFYARGGARDVAGGTALPGMPSWGDSIGTIAGIAKSFI